MRLQTFCAALIFASLVAAPMAETTGEQLNGLGRMSESDQGLGRAIEGSSNTGRPPVELSAYHPKMVSLGDAGFSSPPDFSNYRNTLVKKKAFYDYLLPLVHKANEEVIAERRWLQVMGEQLVQGDALSPVQLEALAVYEARYLVQFPAETTAQRIQELLRRVDVVPASLIIAQAAKESGWGTSRFATEGNNFFGIWCFYQGCGLTPKRRDLGRSHEVATFTSVDEGVRYYVRTINTHIAYTDLRMMRAEARKESKNIEGIDLANGLERYSERGMAYVREVQSMIRNNNMQRFNKGYQA